MPTIRLNDFAAYRLFEALKGLANKGVPHWRRQDRIYTAWGIEEIEEHINANVKQRDEFEADLRAWEGAGRQGTPPTPPKLHEFRTDDEATARETEYGDLEFLHRLVAAWDTEDTPAPKGNEPSALPTTASQFYRVYLSIFEAVEAAWASRVNGAKKPKSKAPTDETEGEAEGSAAEAEAS